MRFLVDTQIAVWQAREPRRLSPAAIALLDDDAAELTVSVVTLWEVVIKDALPRAPFAMDTADFRGGLFESGYSELPVNADHVLEVSNLPPIHGDPFDRILLAQARVEGMTFITADRRLAEYGYPVRVV